MKIEIIAVGKLDRQSFRDLEKDFAGRIKRYAGISIHEVPEPGGKFNNPDEIVKRYSAQLEKLIAKRKFFLCDQRGKEHTSSSFASWLNQQLSTPPNELVLVVGGSHGFSRALFDAASGKISFSALTFPHQLFRIMLLEQLYRGCTIINGEKYHK